MSLRSRDYYFLMEDKALTNGVELPPSHEAIDVVSVLMIKPDAAHRMLSGKIRTMVEDRALQVIGILFTEFTEDLCAKFFRVAGRHDITDNDKAIVAAYLSSGPVEILAVFGRNAPSVLTDIAKKAAETYGASPLQSLVHAPADAVMSLMYMLFWEENGLKLMKRTPAPQQLIACPRFFNLPTTVFIICSSVPSFTDEVYTGCKYCLRVRRPSEVDRASGHITSNADAVRFLIRIMGIVTNTHRKQDSLGSGVSAVCISLIEAVILLTVLGDYLFNSRVIELVPKKSEYVGPCAANQHKRSRPPADNINASERLGHRYVAIKDTGKPEDMVVAISQELQGFKHTIEFTQPLFYF